MATTRITPPTGFVLDEIPEPPEGFTLDGVPAPPSGFTLDSVPPPPAGFTVDEPSPARSRFEPLPGFPFKVSDKVKTAQEAEIDRLTRPPEFDWITTPVAEIAQKFSAQTVKDAADFMYGKALEGVPFAPELNERGRELYAGQSRKPGEVSKVIAGLQTVAADTVNSFTSPLGLATLGSGALAKPLQKIVTTAFAAHMTKGAAQGLGTIAGGGLPEGTQEKVELVGGTLVNAVFAAALAKHGIKPGQKIPPEKEKAVLGELNKMADEMEKSIPFDQQAEATRFVEPSGLRLKAESAKVEPVKGDIPANEPMLDILAGKQKPEVIEQPVQTVQAIFDANGKEAGTIRPTRKLEAMAKAREQGNVLEPSGQVIITPRQGRFIVDETGGVLEVADPASITARERALLKEMATLPENAIALSEKTGEQFKNTIFVDAEGRARIGEMGAEPDGSRPVNLTMVERAEIQRQAEIETQIDQILAEQAKAEPAKVSRKTIDENLPEREPISPAESEQIATQFKQRVPSEASRGQVEFDRPASAQTRTEPATAEPEAKPGLIAGSQLELWANKVLKEFGKEAGTRLHMNPMDVKLLPAIAVKGAALLERGVTNAAEWSAQMIREYGPSIRPYLRQIRKQSEELRAQAFKTGSTPQPPSEPGQQRQAQATPAAQAETQTLRMREQETTPAPEVDVFDPVANPRMPHWLKRPSSWGGEQTLRKAGLPELADALRVWEDSAAKLESDLTNGFARIQQDLTSREFGRAKQEAAEFIRLRERGGTKTERETFKQDAERFRDNASEGGRRLIDWMQETGQETGRIAKDLNVHVEQADGTVRPMGDLGADHFPRMFNQRTLEILKDPYGAKNIADYNRMLSEMVENGNAKTLAEADHLLKKNWNEKTSTDFLGNAELARGMRLPESFYDVSLDGYLSFLNRFSDRMSQIKAFGQSLKDRKDLFGKSADKTRDAKLKSYISRLKDAIYQTRQNDPLIKFYQKLRITAGLAYLSGPITAARNLISAITSTSETFGTRNAFMASTRGLIDAASAFVKTAARASTGNFTASVPKMVREASELGAVRRDLFSAAMMDIHPSGKLKTAAKYGLWMNGAAERLGRAINTGAALTWLRQARVKIQANPKSRAARLRLATLQRLGFQGERLQRLLDNDPDAVGAFARASVRLKQYGYTASQSPLLLDHNHLSFMTQFLKWGYQRMSDFDVNIVKPILEGTVVNGVKTRDFMPLARYALLAIGSGELIALIREQGSGKERRDAGIEEIENTLTENQERGISLALQRIASDVSMHGGLGLLTDSAYQSKRWFEGSDDAGVINSPGLSVLSQIGGFIKARAQRGMTMDGIQRDIQDLLLKFPLVSQTEKPVLAAMNAIGLAERREKIKQGREDVTQIRSIARRFLEETQGEKSGAYKKYAKDEKSEVYDSIYEALLIGDSETAIKIRDEYLGDIYSDAYDRKFKSLKLSVGKRSVLGVLKMNMQEQEDFRDWIKKRVPSETGKLERLEENYLQAREASDL